MNLVKAVIIYVVILSNAKDLMLPKIVILSEGQPRAKRLAGRSRRTPTPSLTLPAERTSRITLGK